MALLYSVTTGGAIQLLFLRGFVNSGMTLRKTKGNAIIKVKDSKMR